MENTYDKTIQMLHEAAKLVLVESDHAAVFKVPGDLASIFNRTLVEVAQEQGVDLEEARSIISCGTCQKNIQKIAGLVRVVNGKFTPVYWNAGAVSDPYYHEVVRRMAKIVSDKTSGDTSHLIPFNKNSTSPVEFNIGKDGVTWKHFSMDTDLITRRFKLDKLRVRAFLRFITETVTIQAIDAFISASESERIALKGNALNELKELRKVLVAVNQIKSENPDKFILDARLRNYALELITTNNPATRVINSVVEAPLCIASNWDSERGIMRYMEATDPVRYRRTVAEADEKELKRISEFLNENGYMRSLAQVEATIDEIPCVWREAEQNNDGETSDPTDFDAVMLGSGTHVPDWTSIPDIVVDAGEFVNKYVKHAEKIELITPSDAIAPMFINRMRFMDARPIFKWDTGSERIPYVPWGWSNPTTLKSLIGNGSKIGLWRANKVIKVAGVTLSDSLYRMDASQPTILIALDGIHNSDPVPPALFAEALLPELNHCRRALEGYSGKVNVPREEGRQGVAFVAIGHSKYRETPNNTLRLHVTLTDEAVKEFGVKHYVLKVPARSYNTEVVDRAVQPPRTPF